MPFVCTNANVANSPRTLADAKVSVPLVRQTSVRGLLGEVDLATLKISSDLRLGVG